MQDLYWNRRRETLLSWELKELQSLRLERLVKRISRLPFHKRRLEEAGACSVDSLKQIEQVPFFTRDEWMASQVEAPPWGSLLAVPPSAALRAHKTSGTTGREPLRVLDTRTDWEWIAEMWCYALWGFGVRPTDTIFLAFGYGGFIGFWGAHAAAEKIGCLVVPGGNMTTEARVRELSDIQATVVCATPTYAFRLAQEAEKLGIDLPSGPVRSLILSGEPAGSVPASKSVLERLWGAKVGDTAGMTEVGTVSMFECTHRPNGMHIIEDHFIEEVIDPVSGERLPYGEMGERVVTSFGRNAIPLLRYRTGDMVVRVPAGECGCGRTFDLYEGGIRGRIDDMKLVRGTNIYPSSVEAIVREFPEVQEFQIRLYTAEGIRDEIELDVEWREDLGKNGTSRWEALGKALAAAHGGLRFGLRRAEPNTLPRYELKAKRLVDERVPLGTELPT